MKITDRIRALLWWRPQPRRAVFSTARAKWHAIERYPDHDWHVIGATVVGTAFDEIVVVLTESEAFNLEVRRYVDECVRTRVRDARESKFLVEILWQYDL